MQNKNQEKNKEWNPDTKNGRKDMNTQEQPEGNKTDKLTKTAGSTVTIYTGLIKLQDKTEQWKWVRNHTKGGNDKQDMREGRT